MTNYGKQSRLEPDGTGLPRVSSDMFRNPELQYDIRCLAQHRTKMIELG